MNSNMRKLLKVTLIAMAIVIIAVAVVEMATQTPREEFESRLAHVVATDKEAILGALKAEVAEILDVSDIRYEDYYIAGGFFAGTPYIDVVVLTADDCKTYTLEANDSFIVNILREDVNEKTVVETIKSATYNLEGDKIIVSQ